MVVRTKVCELTDGFLWFVCGNFNVSPNNIIILGPNVHLKRRYHESVSNIKYSVVSLTTVCWEKSHFRSIKTSSLVTSQISREWAAVTTYPFLAASS